MSFWRLRVRYYISLLGLVSHLWPPWILVFVVLEIIFDNDQFRLQKLKKHLKRSLLRRWRVKLERSWDKLFMVTMLVCAFGSSLSILLSLSMTYVFYFYIVGSSCFRWNGRFSRTVGGWAWWAWEGKCSVIGSILSSFLSKICYSYFLPELEWFNACCTFYIFLFISFEYVTLFLLEEKKIFILFSQCLPKAIHMTFFFFPFKECPEHSASASFDWLVSFCW